MGGVSHHEEETKIISGKIGRGIKKGVETTKSKIIKGVTKTEKDRECGREREK